VRLGDGIGNFFETGWVLWAPIGFAVAGHCDAGQFGGRVGVGKTAPDRATVTDR
jgi:hypothetical protein